jgi:stage V sporulation protein B
MKKDASFIKGASLLALSVILAKILGAVYRIPLTNIVGAEGMGIYQFVYPVFALILTLSSGAVPTAISITISKRLALNDEVKARSEFSVAIKICLMVGLMGTILLIGLAYPLSLLQSTDAFIGYLVVAPAVFIVTLISAFRGWFMGHKNMTPSSLSQITEGIVKLSVGLLATKLLLPYGIKYAVAGALFGVVASEFVTLVILFIIYIVKDKNIEKIHLKDEKESLKKLWKLVLPLILCGMVLPINQFVDSILLVNLLRWAGTEYSTAIMDYGVYTGTVFPLINLPVMVCISIGIAITPQMVEGKIKRDIDFIMAKVTTATKMIFVLCVPFVLIFIFMSENIIRLLYPSLGDSYIALAGNLLSISAISLLVLSIFQIYSAMLQGLDKIYVPLKIMSVCVVIKLLISIIIVPIMGIAGAAISAAIGYSIAGISIMVYFGRFVRVADGLAKNTSLIALCGVIMSMIIVLTAKLQNNIVTMILIATGSMAVYFVFLLVLKVFTKEELGSLPLGKFLLKVDSVFHRN